MILAATGEERMRSERPKPLHLLCGRPMLQYVVDSLGGTQVDRVVVVVGANGEQISKKITETAADPRLVFVETPLSRGPAEAALRGLESFHDDFADDNVLVLPGNAPLLRPELIADLVAHHDASGAAATVLGVAPATDLDGGRIVGGKEPGTIAAIDSDLAADGVQDPDDRWIDAGVYCFRRSFLAPSIRRLRPDPITGMYVFAGVVEVLTEAGHRAEVFHSGQPQDAIAVHDRVQLAKSEAAIRSRTNLRWMQQGVTMLDPQRTYIDTTVALSADVTLFPGTLLQGDTVVGPGAEIGPDTRLIDCAIGARARVEKAMGSQAEVGEDAHVGPFAVLDPGAHVADGTATGPFYHGTD
jgi:bifunctional UDP-N-acetylglucosamine pyrophosphorylase/glucosamine-1-phosphate N-acetyltransferase